MLHCCFGRLALDYRAIDLSNAMEMLQNQSLSDLLLVYMHFVFHYVFPVFLKPNL